MPERVSSTDAASGEFDVYVRWASESLAWAGSPCHGRVYLSIDFLNRYCSNSALHILHGIAEDLQARSNRFLSACPVRVLRGVDVAFGVGHQAQHDAGFIADAGDVVGAAVGVVGKFAGRVGSVGICVGKDDLAAIPQCS